VWGYTPRQLRAFLFLNDRRKRREAALSLSITANGSRAEPKAVKKLMKELTK